jgi:hypothetical protein
VWDHLPSSALHSPRGLCTCDALTWSAGGRRPHDPAICLPFQPRGHGPPVEHGPDLKLPHRGRERPASGEVLPLTPQLERAVRDAAGQLPDFGRADDAVGWHGGGQGAREDREVPESVVVVREDG